MSEFNFAQRLVARLGPRSLLRDTATNEVVPSRLLRHQIANCAAALRAEGLRQGDRILIGCTLSIASVLTYLGSIYAGLVAVPVDDCTLRESPDMMVKASGARALWTERPFSHESREHPALLLLQGALDQGDTVRDSVEMSVTASASPADLAALMATSGSTGIPRFVMVSHENLIANTEAIIRSQGLCKDEMAMLVLPLSYCFGASVLHTHLWQGGGAVLDRRFMFPDKILESMARFECTTFAGVPTAYNLLLQRPQLRQIAIPKLRRFVQAGGAMSPDKIDEMRNIFPQAKFYAMYGQTEATSRISCLNPERWQEKRGSVGRPLDNLQIRIVNEEGNDLPLGNAGELLVKGPSICAGYWNNPEETQQIFRGGWLRTGDIARQDADGYLWIEGRKSAFLKMRGIRVGFPEIEARVMAIPGITECTARAITDAEAGEALILYVVPGPGEQIATEDVRRRLPANWTIHSIRMLPELPKNSRGKVAPAALPI